MSDQDSFTSGYSDVESDVSFAEEDLQDYKKDGYHPVAIGDRFDNGRYIVVRKLGWGHFSTVWLVYDTTTDTHVALKVVKSASRYTESALEEIKILECIKKTNPSSDGFVHVTQLLDHFWHNGPHGRHACMTFEVLGESLLTLMKRYNYKGIPLNIVKSISRQILQGLDYLHRECGIIHTDLKPENVMVWIPNIESHLKKETREILDQLLPMSKSRKKRLKKKLKKQKAKSAAGEEEEEEEEEEKENGDLEAKFAQLEIQQNRDQEGLKVIQSSVLDFAQIMDGTDAFDNIMVKIADLGNACWTDGDFAHVIQTRQYRSPEVIVGAKWTSEADMWSTACMIFELITSEFLFDPKAGPNYNKDDDHLAQILELMRTAPKILVTGGEFSREYFDRSGKLKHIVKLNYRRLRDVLHDSFLVNPENADKISAFLLPMLEVDMVKRLPASQMLQHAWLN